MSTADGTPHLLRSDKKNRQRLAAIRTAGLCLDGMTAYMHSGKQYIVVQLPNGLEAPVSLGAAPAQIS
jgi:hypothetical protein